MLIGILVRLVFFSAITILLLIRKENQQVEYFPQQTWSAREVLPVYWAFILIAWIWLILFRTFSDERLYIVGSHLLMLLAGFILYIAAKIIICKKRRLSLKVIGIKTNDVYWYVILIAIQFSIFTAVLFFGGKGIKDYSYAFWLLADIPITLVFSPVIEEVFYLGMMFIPTSRIVGLKTSAVLVSLSHALVHFDHNAPEVAINFVIFGLLGCYLYIKTKRIVVPLLVHSSINFLLLMRDVNSFSL